MKHYKIIYVINLLSMVSIPWNQGISHFFSYGIFCFVFDVCLVDRCAFKLFLDDPLNFIIV